MDEWALAAGVANEVVAQIGAGAYLPHAVRWVRNMPPADFKAHCRDARAVVAHAGMGSVLTVIEFGRPLLLLPRQGALRETRNDHQLATARWLASRPGIWVADTESQIATLMPQVLQAGGTRAQAAEAPPPLVDGLRSFINQA